MATLKYTPQGMERRDDGIYIVVVEDDEAVHIDEVPPLTVAAIVAALKAKAGSVAENRGTVNRFMADKDIFWLDGVEDRVSDDDLVEPDQERAELPDEDPQTIDVSDETPEDATTESDDATESGEDEGAEGEQESDQDDESEGDGQGEGDSPPIEFHVDVIDPETGEGRFATMPAEDLFQAVQKMIAEAIAAQPEQVDAPTPETFPEETPQPLAPAPKLPRHTVDEGQYKENGRMYHAIEPEVIAAAMGGQHVFLWGPPGTGKSELAVRYARMTGQQLDIVSCHPHLTVSALVGYQTAEGLKPGPMLLSAKAEGVLLLDEVDNTGPGVHASANSSMANNLIQIQDTRVNIGPNWRMFLTANTMGQGATSQFVGRQKLDAATLDRVASFFVPTDEVLEHNLLVAMGMDKDDLREWHTIIRRMRDNVDFHGLSCFVSMRTTLAGARQLMVQRTPEWRRAGYKVLAPIEIARMRVLSKVPAEQAAKILD